MTSAANTRQKHKEIIKHILTTMLVENETIEIVTGDELKINTVERLRSVTETQLSSTGKLAVGDIIDIVCFQEWGKKYFRTTGKHLPTVLEEWKNIFTSEAFASSVNTANLGSQEYEKSITDRNSASTTKHSYVSVKIGDYPVFTGRHQDWYGFRTKCEALARLHGFTEVLAVQNVDEHIKRRENEPDYDAKVRDMYSILQLRTSDSTAASTVTKCSQTQDGALAWKNLKEYFDQDGNKDVCEYVVDENSPNYASTITVPVGMINTTASSRKSANK